MNKNQQMKCRMLATLAAACALALGAPPTYAKYPDRPITMVVPFPPGGPTDVFARVVSDALSHELGKTIIIDNRGGAAGNIGVGIAAKAVPDGYTILFGTASIAIAPSVYKKLSYEPLRDLQPVALVGAVPAVVLVPPDGPRNIQELVGLLKSKPGEFSYATSGYATATHLITELFNKNAAVNALHVPYRGSGPAKQGMLSKLHMYTFETASSTVSVVNSGLLKAIAIAGEKRSPLLPELPTIVEAGIPGVVGSTWNMVFVPAGTDSAVTKRLNTAINTVLSNAEVKSKLAELAVDVTNDSSPDSAKSFLASEIQRWEKIVQATGVQPQ